MLSNSFKKNILSSFHKSIALMTIRNKLSLFFILFIPFTGYNIHGIQILHLLVSCDNNMLIVLKIFLTKILLSLCLSCNACNACNSFYVGDIDVMAPISQVPSGVN